jgi:hypothetical protein
MSHPLQSLSLLDFEGWVNQICTKVSYSRISKEFPEVDAALDEFISHGFRYWYSQLMRIVLWFQANVLPQQTKVTVSAFA